MNDKWMKIGGIALSVLGAGVSLASDLMGKKQATDKLANSKEVKDLIAKEVAEAISKTRES